MATDRCLSQLGPAVVDVSHTERLCLRSRKTDGNNCLPPAYLPAGIRNRGLELVILAAAGFEDVNLSRECLELPQRLLLTQA